MNYNWNWHIFFEPNPIGTGTYLDMLLSGLVLTIKTALLAWIIALVFGSIVGVLRTLPSKTASWIGFGYVEFFRNMPLLVQLFLWFFVLPELLPRAAGLWLKQLPNAPFWTAAIGVGLFMSARVAVQLARRHRLAAARAEAGGDRARADHGAGLSLRAAADGIPHHPAAADVRISQHHQEHVGRDHHRPDRTDRPGARDAGIFLPGVRGLHGRDRDVSR